MEITVIKTSISNISLLTLARFASFYSKSIAK